MMIKVTFANFSIKTYSIMSIKYMYKISCKFHDKNFLRYRFLKKPSAGRVKRHELFDTISQTNLETSTAWNVSTCGVFPSLYFPVFSPNTGKYGPEKTPYLDTFHVVSRTHNSLSSNLFSEKLQSVLRTVSNFRCMMFPWNKLTPLQLPS